mmetsp:Transcript_20133/g.30279  ORF Transcript_20133/g.30279 Transcript_20133/m.30279 type:complete len:144 (+) Transcript_20133:907-1338(+)
MAEVDIDKKRASTTIPSKPRLRRLIRVNIHNHITNEEAYTGFRQVLPTVTPGGILLHLPSASRIEIAKVVATATTTLVEAPIMECIRIQHIISILRSNPILEGVFPVEKAREATGTTSNEYSRNSMKYYARKKGIQEKVLIIE